MNTFGVRNRFICAVFINGMWGRPGGGPASTIVKALCQNTRTARRICQSVSPLYLRVKQSIYIVRLSTQDLFIYRLNLSTYSFDLSTMSLYLQYPPAYSIHL
jgi:hypothetical protein